LIPLFLILATGCSKTVWQANFIQPAEYHRIDPSVPFLKCHTDRGEVLVLSEWQVDEAKQSIVGKGIRYDSGRKAVERGPLTVPMAEVRLVETNEPRSVTKGHIVTLGVMTGVSLAVTAACLANPKACFGSCPTFYAADGSGELALQAEGFSASVARSLEATDVDALFTARPTGRDFQILMTNDALETHAVRSVRLLAVRQPDGGRVFHGGDRFYSARSVHSPLACRSERGECLPAVVSVDDREYHSPADPENLAAREVIDLTFPAVAGPKGLVIAGRNTLLNTFLFYQVLAYMGLRADDWLIGLDQGGREAREFASGMGRVMGNVEVSVLTAVGRWVAIAAFEEVGPIAREVQLIPIPEKVAAELPEGVLRVRLTLARGNWKIDHVGLAEIDGEAAPVPIQVSRVTREGIADSDALDRLLDPDLYLITYPGDAYNLHFDLPEERLELFLETRGYYYEWMRREWLAEEDQMKAADALTDPVSALCRLAPAYKKIEGRMEEYFWRSRVGRRLAVEGEVSP